MAIKTSRLFEALALAGLDKAELARRVDINRSLLTTAEKKPEHDFKFTTGINICRELNISPEYLLGGIDTPAPYIYAKVSDAHQQLCRVLDVKGNDVAEFSDHADKPHYQRFSHGVPVIGTSSNGPDANYFEREQPRNYGSEFINMPLGADYFALRIDKPTLQGRGRVGDALLLDTKTECQPGDDVLLMVREQWHIGTIASTRHGIVTLETDAERQVIDNGQIAAIYLICSVAHSAKILPRL